MYYAVHTRYDLLTISLLSTYSHLLLTLVGGPSTNYGVRPVGRGRCTAWQTYHLRTTHPTGDPLRRVQPCRGASRA